MATSDLRTNCSQQYTLEFRISNEYVPIIKIFDEPAF